MGFVSSKRWNPLNEGYSARIMLAELENIHANITKVASLIDGSGTTNVFVSGSSSTPATSTASFNIRTGVVAVVAGSNRINYVSTLTSSDYGLPKPVGRATDGSEMNVQVSSQDFTGFTCWCSDAGFISYTATEII